MIASVAKPRAVNVFLRGYNGNFMWQFAIEETPAPACS